MKRLTGNIIAAYAIVVGTWRAIKLAVQEVSNG